MKNLHPLRAVLYQFAFNRIQTALNIQDFNATSNTYIDRDLVLDVGAGVWPKWRGPQNFGGRGGPAFCTRIRAAVKPFVVGTLT